MLGRAFGTFLFAAAIMTVGYTLASSEPCERVYRATTPVRLAFDAGRWLTYNWFSQDGRLEFLLVSVQVDVALREFVARTFYGDLLCGSGGLS